jgi:hypothetical protein
VHWQPQIGFIGGVTLSSKERKRKIKVMGVARGTVHAPDTEDEEGRPQ